MHYTVYKITNKINSKIYIGVHKTSNINDDYMGSGKHLKSSQEKYGIENFKKEIIEVFETKEMMFQYESILVNEDFIKDPNTYNLKLGGTGGFDYINSLGGQGARLNQNLSLISRKRGIENSHKTRRENKSIEIKRVNTLYTKYGNDYFGKMFKGKKHSDESKKKMSISQQGKQKGEKNSQFGTTWIYNLELKLSKKIKKTDLPNYISQGWLKGRKMKFA